MYDKEPALTDKDYLLQKYPGKGGWTFAAIAEIVTNQNSWFGWTKVRGSIDGYAIENYHLMPMGNGILMLPIKTEIRKIIGKNEGDWVHITLYSQSLPPVVPEDFTICLADEPIARQNFLNKSEKEQKLLLDWIYSVKNDELKVERIAQTINNLLKYEV